MEPRRPNVGLKLTAEAVADGILERQAEGEKIDMMVIDPAAFASDGGPSIAERLAGRKVFAQRADNSRVGQRGAMGGWDLVRARLIGEDDRPMMYLFSTCVDTIRTFPAAQHDDKRPEDLDTDSEDHALDDVRYACSARPWVRAIEKPKPLKFKNSTQTSVTELIAKRRRERLGAE